MFGWFKKRKNSPEPEHPYEGFFYRMDHMQELGAKPAPEEVKEAVPQGELRELTFKKLMEDHPERLDYLVEYVGSRGYNGVYDAPDIQSCLELVAKGLGMPDDGELHQSLEETKEGFHYQLEELEELPKTSSNEPTLGQRYRSGELDAILADFARLRETVKPVGSIGGDEEKAMWGHWGMAVEIHLDRKEVEEALKLQAEYEEARLAVGLKPLPSYAVQEKLLGYLAQIDITRARAQLQDWLAKSKVLGVPDVIKYHRDFADLFEQL